MAEVECGLVGVVIPVHNRAQTLIDTLSYVASQAVLPHRVVIVDDGSTDGTPDQVEKWLKQQDCPFEWQVVRNPKSLPAAARNVGFEIVKDLPFVAFLDSDDHWPADFLERALAAFESRPDAVAAVSDRKFCVHAEGLTDSPPGADMVDNPIKWMFEFGGGVTSCSVFRTDIVEKVGMWPMHLHAEDTEMFSLIALEGPWAHMEGEPVVINIGNALVRGESVNLTREDDELHLTWGRRWEEIYEMIHQRIPRADRRPLRHSISKIWYMAGRHQTHFKKPEVAADCFRRSVRWNRLNYKGWKRLMKVKRALRSSGSSI